MEITKSGSSTKRTLVVKGKLDAYWSDALSKELDVAVREGAEYVTLDLGGVDFISSAGLRVLLIYLKQLRAINGGLRVVNPSAQVQSILDLSGLTDLLLTTEIPEEENKPVSEEHDAENAMFEIHDLEARGELSYEFFNPDAEPTYTPASSTGYPMDTFGLGVGAFGEKAETSLDRFGEYVAAGGIVTCLPTDGRGHADFMQEDAAFIPTVLAMHGLRFGGEFRKLIRFTAHEHVRSITMSELAREILSLSNAGSVGFVMVAETTGLTGCALRKSSALEDAERMFTFPDVRNWLSYTSEPAHEGCSVLAVGIVAYADEALPYMRPVDAGGWITGHIHAVAFDFLPLASGNIKSDETIRRLYDESEIRGILHLLADHEAGGGAYESAFVRGAIWTGPLAGRITGRSPHSDQERMHVADHR